MKLNAEIEQITYGLNNKSRGMCNHDCIIILGGGGNNNIENGRCNNLNVGVDFVLGTVSDLIVLGVGLHFRHDDPLINI